MNKHESRRKVSCELLLKKKTQISAVTTTRGEEKK
jgi:hypothetical protein